jgi:hypothetical protein
MENGTEMFISYIYKVVTNEIFIHVDWIEIVEKCFTSVRDRKFEQSEKLSLPSKLQLYQ